MKYGIYDTQDNCWMGDDNGPLLYEDELFTRLAAQAMDKVLGWDLGRCRMKVYDGTGDKHKDNVERVMSTLDAIKEMEDGGL